MKGFETTCPRDTNRNFHSAHRQTIKANALPSSTVAAIRVFCENTQDLVYASLAAELLHAQDAHALTHISAQFHLTCRA